MAGLFTLDSEALGVLDTNVLGGPGTGFIVGANSSTGTATGTQGFTGSASGQSTSAGAAAGAPGLLGSVSGSTTNAGTVVGVEGARGSVAGSQTGTGSAAGTPQLSGTATGLSVNGGAVGGSAQLAGTCAGSTTSSGSVTGTVPTPPTPPTPTPTKGGGRRYYVPAPIRQPTVAAGSVVGSSASRGRSRGRCDYNGVSVGASTSVGICRGTSRLNVSPIRVHIDHEHRRRQAEDELLLLELT